MREKKEEELNLMKGGTLHQKVKSRFIYNYINEAIGKTNLPMLEANFARSE